MVGDLIPLKGQDTLIKALQSSPDSPALPPITTLLIGGPRPGEAESEAYAAHLQQIAGPNVHFLGRRSDIPDLLNAIDLLVVASSRETGPLVLLESLACTTPALSTPVGISPDLLPADAIFPVGDAQALRAALQRWLADPARRASTGTTGRSQVIQELSLPSYQSRVLAEIHAFLP